MIEGRSCSRSRTGRSCKAHARTLARQHRGPLAGVVALHGLAAAAGLVGRRCSARSSSRWRGDDDLAHRHRRPRPRGLHRPPDHPHLVRAARVVRPLRADVRRAAGDLHAPRAGAATHGGACRDRRPRLAYDCRSESLARTVRFAIPETLIAAVTTTLTVGAAIWVSPPSHCRSWQACRRSGSDARGTCAGHPRATSGSGLPTRSSRGASGRRSTVGSRSRRLA